MSTGQSGKKSKPLPHAEALVLLRSAIGIVLESGIPVGARNVDDGLIITIRGARVVYHNGKADFVPHSDVPHSDVPQLAEVPQSDCGTPERVT